MIGIVREDGSGESVAAQMVRQHRAGFSAGVDLRALDEPTPAEQPAPAEAYCHTGEYASDPASDVRGPMQMLAGVFALVAVVGAAVLLWPSEAPQPKPVKPVSLGVWA